MHTECFELVSFDFVVGIGVFLNIYFNSRYNKTYFRLSIYEVDFKFNNTVDIKLGEFHEANAFKNYEFNSTRASSSKVV